jgi:hypothetical protein
MAAEDKPSLKKSLSVLWKDAKEFILKLNVDKKSDKKSFGDQVLTELRKFSAHYSSYPTPVRNVIIYLIKNTPAWVIASVPSLAHHYSSKLKLARYAKKKTAVRGYRKYLRTYGSKRRTYRRRRTTTRRRSYPRRRYTRRRRYSYRR